MPSRPCVPITIRRHPSNGQSARFALRIRGLDCEDGDVRRTIVGGQPFSQIAKGGRTRSRESAVACGGVECADHMQQVQRCVERPCQQPRVRQGCIGWWTEVRRDEYLATACVPLDGNDS